MLYEYNPTYYTHVQFLKWCSVFFLAEAQFVFVYDFLCIVEVLRQQTVIKQSGDDKFKVDRDMYIYDI